MLDDLVQSFVRAYGRGLGYNMARRTQIVGVVLVVLMILVIIAEVTGLNIIPAPIMETLNVVLS
jgi:hypothetical protein